MNRRWVCAFRIAKVSSSLWISMSSHGEIRLSGAPSSTRSSTSIPTIVCIHVVPHFDGVEMTTSSGRSSNRFQRSLSEMNPEYRRTEHAPLIEHRETVGQVRNDTLSRMVGDGILFAVVIGTLLGVLRFTSPAVRELSYRKGQLWYLGPSTKRYP